MAKILFGKNIEGAGSPEKTWYGKAVYDGDGNEISKTYVKKGEVTEGASTAADVSLVDTDGHYEAENVEGALSEIGVSMAETGTRLTALEADNATTKTDINSIKEKVDSIDSGSGSGGAVTSGAVISVSVPTGAVVTCADGNDKVVGTATAENNKVTFNVAYGTYKVSAVLGEVESVSTEKIVVDDLRIYYTTLVFDGVIPDGTGYRLHVFAETDAVVTVVNSTSTQIKTVQGDDDFVSFYIMDWRADVNISVVKSGVTLTRTVKYTAVDEYEKNERFTFAKIAVRGATGQSVNVSMGTYSYTKVLQSDNEVYVVYLPELGTWSVVATLYNEVYDRTETYTRTIEVDGYNCHEVACWHKVYAFHIDGNITDPAAKIKYLEENANFTPAKMIYATPSKGDYLDYGSWKRDDFFFPRPCMLKSDGTVDYYLNDKHYGFKADSNEESDVCNPDYDGNAMMEWGRYGKKIWCKIVPDENDATSATVYISDSQIDEDYHAWSFMNSKGEYVDHFYTPIYNGTVINGKMRSLSGFEATCSNTAAKEIEYAEANNPDDRKMWYTEVYADITLINLLLMLIGKSTDTQATFGYGNCSGSKGVTGQLDDAGFFYGTKEANTRGVKVFGMENWWGNVRRRYAGHVTDSGGNHMVKYTYGTQDGSTANSYNATGAGYIPTNIASVSGYIVKEKYDNKFGMIPSEVTSGSATTNYCDYSYGGKNCYAYRGGDWSVGTNCGAFYVFLSHSATHSYSYIGAAISCKPVRKGE